MSDTSELPVAWSERFSELVGVYELQIAGLATRVEVTRNELAHAYLPLLQILNSRAAEAPRIVAGLAGIPGGGKSTFAAVLAHVADRLISPGWLMIVPMDGWHWPNAVLDSRTILDEEGRSVPLRTRKGGPESFDTDALIAALLRLRTSEKPILLPAYDRQLHEPVEDAIRVGEETRVVLVEGNYVLGGIPGHPAWKGVAEHLSPKFYLACDLALAREQVVTRHVHGGASAKVARQKYAANDAKNAAAVVASAGRADYALSLSPPDFRSRAE